MLVTHEKMSSSTYFRMLFQINGDAAGIIFNIKTACSQAKKHLTCEISPEYRLSCFQNFTKETYNISVSKSESISDIYLICFALKMHNVKCLEASFI